MRRLYFFLWDFVEVGGGLFHDPQFGSLCNKIPCRLAAAIVFFIFFPHSCKQCSVIKQKIPRLCLRD